LVPSDGIVLFLCPFYWAYWDGVSEDVKGFDVSFTLIQSKQHRGRKLKSIA